MHINFETFKVNNFYNVTYQRKNILFLRVSTFSLPQTTLYGAVFDCNKQINSEHQRNVSYVITF